ncbi:MAG: PP2C family serine/threonine-protein phosphatase [Congregibacter sp.]
MILFAARTHPGLRREKNEDNYAADAELGLWVVADGVGGHSNGEVASAIACEIIRNDVEDGKTLCNAIEHAHKSVLHEIAKRDAASNMGTTVVAMRMHQDEYEVAWVGDSRAYLYDGKLRQLTRDHSAVNDLLDSGAITPEQAKGHPQRHALSRSLGVSDTNASAVSSITGTLRSGAQVLLCSDGLTDELNDAAIENELALNDSPEAQAEALLGAALAKGGRDNLTILVVGAPGSRRRDGKTRTPDLETTQNVGGAQVDSTQGAGFPVGKILLVLAVLMLAAVSVFS